MFVTHPGNVFSLDAAKISYIASAVRFSICVNDLTIKPRFGNAEAVTVSHHGRCVHHKTQ